MKCIVVSKMMNTKVMSDCLHSEMHTGAYKFISDSVFPVKCIPVSRMMNIKLMSDFFSLLKYIQVSKMMNTKLMSDSVLLVICLHVIYIF